MIAYLQKSEGSKGLHQIIDFLTSSHIKYALTENPTIYVSLIEQFWQTATASTLEDGDMGITATIDGKVKVVSEASIRRHLKLEDSDGISTLSTVEIFEQLSIMGYVSNSDSLTFQKGHFSPQWKFLIHTILHCLSSKKTAWEQFSSNIATAIICLAANRTFNFSKLIFEAMGQTLQGEGSTIPVESHYTPTSAPSTSQPPTSSPSMPTTHVAEEAALMPYDSPLLRVHSLGSDEGSLTLNELTVLCTSLSKKGESLESDLKQTKQTYGVKKLEHKVKSIKARRKVRFVVSDDEDDLEGPSKQGRKIAQIDKDDGITLSINEEVVLLKPDMDVTLAEALLGSLEEGKKKVTKPKARGISLSRLKSCKKEESTQRAAEQRSKPPSKTQMRNRMCTYLKNMGGYKHNQLKGKSYEEIQKLFDKTYKQVNSCVPMASDDKKKGSEKKAGGSRKKTLAKKRAGEKQSEESSKRQKMEGNAEKEELKAHLDIIPGDDVAVSVESLATKYPIVDWKTHILSEDKMYYEIIKANGSTKSYKIFIEMLDDFDRQDVLDLFRLVKERFETANPEGYDRLLWGYLITVFEPSKDDEVWKAQQDYTLISWRLFDSCGI
ncbi:hypothetical protein Tco_1498949 [Tanacetum coccineum]